ncbi:MAG: efflux RND transporter periplasmic adaptor subunit [Verrucomicrobiota bacterium]|nr:efflux RND transporter periplasmic adaptor subunit [Verrucomicrobiota bacterium]
MQKHIFILAGLVLISGVFSGCGKKAGPGAGQAPAPQVIAATPKRQTVAETLSLVGTINADEMVELRSETDGIVEEINFKEGQRVEKGNLLVRLDESKFAALVEEGEANFKLSQANYDRAKQLYNDKLISQQEFDQAASVYAVSRASLELNKRQLRDARILAPFSGIVSARNISPGQVITKNSTLTWIIDMDPVKVEFNVPERFVSQLKVGQKIDVKVATFQDRTFSGTVFFVSPFVNPTNRSAQVKAEIPNKEFLLKPGMFANLDLTLTVRENSLVIPETSLAQVLDRDKAMVFVVDAQGNAQIRQVGLGIRLPGLVEIVSGVTENEVVIIEGVQKAIPGKPVRVVPPDAPTNNRPETTPVDTAKRS